MILTVTLSAAIDRMYRLAHMQVGTGFVEPEDVQGLMQGAVVTRSEVGA